jgi:hypothetical protein
MNAAKKTMAGIGIFLATALGGIANEGYAGAKKSVVPADTSAVERLMEIDYVEQKIEEMISGGVLGLEKRATVPIEAEATLNIEHGLFTKIITSSPSFSPVMITKIVNILSKGGYESRLESTLNGAGFQYGGIKRDVNIGGNLYFYENETRGNKRKLTLYLDGEVKGVPGKAIANIFSRENGDKTDVLIKARVRTNHGGDDSIPERVLNDAETLLLKGLKGMDLFKFLEKNIETLKKDAVETSDKVKELLTDTEKWERFINNAQEKGNFTAEEMNYIKQLHSEFSVEAKGF